MNLYGKTYTRREIEARVSRIEQIGGVRRMTLTEGPEAGVEVIQVRTGGLSFEVTPSKGMDISLAEYFGLPLSWLSPNGEVHPSYFSAQGTDWLRSASGGLLMTCGLTQVGAPCVDGSEPLGLHGRAHHLPARQVSARGFWSGDEYEIEVSGVMAETSMFGHHLRWTRIVRAHLGHDAFEIRDQVENAGFAKAPHMMLYHFNFGFPLLSDETTIEFPSVSVAPRDARSDVEGYRRWQAPTAGIEEMVYYHEPIAHTEGVATATIRTPGFPVAGRRIGVELGLSWKVDTLPRLVQWKLPAAGMYVLGLEPANCHVEGRPAEREKGTLVYLEPGASATYEIAVRLALSHQPDGEA